MDELLLYHTGFARIKTPDIHRGRRNADFGQGFYLTSDSAFAERWAVSRKGMDTYLNTYVLVLDGLAVRRFSREADWYEYIAANRANREDALQDCDVIIGPIANDTIYDTGGILTSGLLDADTALALLTIGPAYEQAVIKTEKAAAQLHWQEARILSPEEIRNARKTVEAEEEWYLEMLAHELEEFL